MSSVLALKRNSSTVRYCFEADAEPGVLPRALELLAKRGLVPARVFAPSGCLECRNTGFLGRTGIYEMMRISSPLRQLIQHDLDLEKLVAAALNEGMRPLRVSAVAQVARGVTTIAEVVGVLPPIEA